MTITITDDIDIWVKQNNFTLTELFWNTHFQDAFIEYMEDQAFDNAVQNPVVRSQLKHLSKMI